jgi:site-specific DNA-methyltransferase (adenine-specific)
VKNMDMQSGATTVYAKFSGRSRRGLGCGGNRVVEETVAPQYTLDDSDNGASKYFPTFHPLDVPFKYNPKSNKAESTLNGTIPNEHPTVKPLSLAAWVVRLLTPKGGVVLDPYAGSGSIPCAAVMEGFDTIGIDRWESVVEQTARPRLAHYLKQREEREDAEDIFNLAFGDPTAEP